MRLRQFPDREQFGRLAENSSVIPVCREILADMETPVTILQKIQGPDRPVFLLESMEGGERWGRYSFLGASCRSRLQVFRRHVEVLQNGTVQKSPHHGDPMGFLRQFMQSFRPAVVPGLPRFWGGLVGYLTYEMVAFFEAIPNRLPETTPLAEFMLPDEILIFDNLANTLMLVALIFTEDHSDTESAYRAACAQLEAMNARILKPPAIEIAAAVKDGCHLTPGAEPEAFRRRVKTVKEYIRAGDIIQAVISQPFRCRPAPDLVSLYRAQRYINPSPYLFFLHLDQMALIGDRKSTRLNSSHYS